MAAPFGHDEHRGRYVSALAPAMRLMVGAVPMLWRSAWWRKALVGMNHLSTDSDRRRLNRDTHRAEHWRRDAVVLGFTGPRDSWHRMEPGFVARVLRRTPKPTLPRRVNDRRGGRCIR